MRKISVDMRRHQLALPRLTGRKQALMIDSFIGDVVSRALEVIVNDKTPLNRTSYNQTFSSLFQKPFLLYAPNFANSVVDPSIDYFLTNKSSTHREEWGSKLLPNWELGFFNSTFFWVCFGKYEKHECENQKSEEFQSELHESLGETASYSTNPVQIYICQE